MKELLNSDRADVLAYAQELADSMQLMGEAKEITYTDTVCGHGYCSDPSLLACIPGTSTQTPYYRAWVNMMNRVYNPDSRYYSAYEDVTVCEEWHDRAVFTKWMKSRKWQGCSLDKDLLVPGNKVYSPHNCCFISAELNSCLVGIDSKEFDDKGRPQNIYTLKLTKGFEVWLNGKRISRHDDVIVANRNLLLAKAKYIEENMITSNKRTEEALSRLAADLRAEAIEIDKDSNLFGSELYSKTDHES